MPLVRVVRNYTYPPFFRQSPGSLGEWGSYHFTEEPIEEADYLVVLNYPNFDIKCRINKGGAVLLMQEPPFERNDYFKDFFQFFDLVISHHDFKSKRVIHDQAALPWHLDMNFDELISLNIPNENSKNEQITWITSNVNLYPTHQQRLDFIQKMKTSGLPFSLYGRGFHEIKDKAEVLLQSKYTIAAENYIGNDYWTEKLQDSLLAWNIPFYYGCTNIQKYLPVSSIIPIDLNLQDHSLAIIEKTFNSRHWDRHLDDLADARRIILNKLQFFPKIVEILTGLNCTGKKSIYLVPKDPYKMTTLQKIKTKFFP